MPTSAKAPRASSQFQSGICVLDAYLYPPSPSGEPRVTYLDAREPDGSAIDRASCVAALTRREARQVARLLAAGRLRSAAAGCRRGLRTQTATRPAPITRCAASGAGPLRGSDDFHGVGEAYATHDLSLVRRATSIRQRRLRRSRPHVPGHAVHERLPPLPPELRPATASCLSSSRTSSVPSRRCEQWRGHS